MDLRRTAAVAAALFLTASAVSAALQVNEQAKLTAGSIAGSQMGLGVAIDGDTAVAGIPHAGANAVSVFVRSGTTWPLQQTVTPSEASNQFGASVAISGDTMVVGAPGPTLSRPGGAVFVFVRSGTTWTEQAKFAGSDTAATDSFGSFVAIDGDTIAVTSLANNGGTGAVYVFVRSGVTWTEQQKLVPADAVATDGFGSGVDVEADTIIAGMTGEDIGAFTNAGAAYVFVRSGTTWTEQAKLLSPDPGNVELFGADVDLSGDTAIVGANQEQAANVFVRSGTTWTHQQRLATSNFAWAVGVDGDRAVIGNPRPLSSTGNAHVWTRSGTTWTLLDTIVGRDSAAGDRFGEEVAIDGDALIVGAPGHDGIGVDSGAAYVFAIEAVPGITVGDVTITEGTGGNTPTVFQITLDQPGTSPITVDFATVDETAISALDYGGGTSSVTFAPGETTKTVIVSTFGDSVAESTETYRLDVTSFSGTAVLLDGSGRATILDDDGAGVIVAPTTGLTTTESGGADTFTVVLTSQPVGTVTINLASSDTTEGTVSPASLTFNSLDWNVPQTVTITGVDDAVVDGDVAYTIITTATSTDPFYNGIVVADPAVTNTDNDTGTISITDATAAEGGVATFTVTLSAASPTAVTVNWTTADSTATAGVDYTADSGTLTFAPGETAQTISIATLNDADVETSEVFLVQLTGATGATLLDGEATGTITDIPPAATPIPTMSEWMLMLLAATLAAIGLKLK